ncbi:vascular endothelial growth factor A [Amazona aestiva]|uniref:Vascular endothelial growth factor A n=1 Tax=Amazona aestiva TaxID=12930 RepID=A0A0Q3TU59_AMAAE|nr:vascular endothelial growth factor A [Amazona aestiva]
MALLDFGAIPTGKVNFDPNVHPSAGQNGRSNGGLGEQDRQQNEALARDWETLRNACEISADRKQLVFAPLVGKAGDHVIKFLEVYERSFCRTIETLVDIFQEYPDEVEYIFKPSCVPLMRCAGCCGDEGLECVPVDVYNVTMEIMRIKPHQSQHIAHMSFLQHSKCDCRPKKDVKNKQEKKSKRGKGKGQKRKRKKGRYKPLSLYVCVLCL